jgi:predicted nucleic acid-binding protein
VPCAAYETEGSIEAIDAFMEILGGDHSSVFVPLQRQTARVAADIRSRYNVTLADAFQVAAALEGRCDALLTNDKDLCRVTDLKIVLVEEL